MNTGGEPYHPAYKVRCSPGDHPPETGWEVHDHGQAPAPRVRWLDPAATGSQQLQAQEGVPYDLQLCGQYLAGATGRGEAQQIISGGIQPHSGTEVDASMSQVTWVARLGDSVQSRFEGIIGVNDSGAGGDGSGEKRCSLSGTLYTSDAEVPVTGVLSHPGVRVLPVGAGLHPSNNGISLTRRRISLLQSMSACFCDIGPLSSSDKQVRSFSDQLSAGALELLTSEPSEDVQYWSARMLLALLDTEGAVHLASVQHAVKELLAQALHGVQSPCTVVQSTAIAALVSKLGASASCTNGTGKNSDAGELLSSLLGALHSELAQAAPSAQVSQCLRGLYYSCHNASVRTAMRKEEWSALFWNIADSPRCVAPGLLPLLCCLQAQHLE